MAWFLKGLGGSSVLRGPFSQSSAERGGRCLPCLRFVFVFFCNGVLVLFSNWARSRNATGAVLSGKWSSRLGKGFRPMTLTGGHIAMVGSHLVNLVYMPLPTRPLVWKEVLRVKSIQDELFSSLGLPSVA